MRTPDKRTKEAINTSRSVRPAALKRFFLNPLPSLCLLYHTRPRCEVTINTSRVFLDERFYPIIVLLIVTPSFRPPPSAIPRIFGRGTFNGGSETGGEEVPV